MVSIRWFIAIVGATMAIGGFVALQLPIKLEAMSNGHEISCGSGMTTDGSARLADETNALGRTLEGGQNFFDNTNFAGDCDRKVATRRAWAIPLVATGGVVLLGALLVRDWRMPANTDVDPTPNRRLAEDSRAGDQLRTQRPDKTDSDR